MTRQIVPRSPSLTRPNPLLDSRSTNRSTRLAEVAGGTTADCAAVCCCCPLGLINLIVLAVYKWPAGLYRKALKKRRQRLKKKGLLPHGCKGSCRWSETETQMHPTSVDLWSNDKLDKSDASSKEVQDLDNEMWDRFYSTGFWRSSSQREP